MAGIEGLANITKVNIFMFLSDPKVLAFWSSLGAMKSVVNRRQSAVFLRPPNHFETTRTLKSVDTIEN